MAKYVGLRYVPIFSGEWVNTKVYEPLMIVSNQGNSYTSKTYVPLGVDILNTKYWECTGNYNAQVEAYRQDVLHMKEVMKWVTPESYGAIGDGVTNDTLALQTAINTGLPVLLTGKYLVVPDNTTFHHCLYAVDNMYLFGTGTIKMQPNSYYNVDAIYIEDKKNITIEGIEIVGDLVGHTREASEMWNYWQWLIYADGVDGLTIKDCNIHDSYSMGICVGNLDDAVVNAINKNIIIKNCNVHHNKTNNIAISSAANVIIDGCFVHDVGDVTPRNGIDLETDADTTEAISQVKIINCIIQNNYKGMEIVNRNTLTHIDVSNNMILDCNTGILLSGGVSANVTDIVIDNNLIKGSSIAIDENYVDYKLTNNKILGLTGTGSYAVKISIENTIVKGNIFEGSVTGNYIECTGSIRAVLIKIDANTFENINAQALIGFDCNYMAITNNLIDHQGCTLTDSIIKISGGGERCIISRNTSLGVPLTVPFINSSVVGASSNIDFNSMNTSSLGIPTNANRHYNMLNGTSSDT